MLQHPATIDGMWVYVLCRLIQGVTETVFVEFYISYIIYWMNTGFLL